MQVKTLGGSVIVTKGLFGMISINATNGQVSNIIRPDIAASNGVIHVVDAVVTAHPEPPPGI